MFREIGCDHDPLGHQYATQIAKPAAGGIDQNSTWSNNRFVDSDMPGNDRCWTILRRVQIDERFFAKPLRTIERKIPLMQNSKLQTKRQIRIESGVNE